MTAPKAPLPPTPGFPELTAYEHRCLLCRLTRTNAGLLKLVHKLKYEEDLGEYGTHARMQPVFERHGVPLPSRRAFGRHLTGHIDITQIKELAEFDMPDPTEAQLERLELTEDNLRDLQKIDVALGKNDSDYHNMADLFRRLMRRIAALDADPTAFLTPDGQHSNQRLSTWTNMINNAKSIIEGLNKMRNSDRMTVSILEQHTKRYATAIAGPIGDVIRDVRDELMQVEHPKAREMASRLTLLVDRDVTDIFTDAAVRSLRESREKYKLLN